jgi:hypothetical protein
VSQTVAAWRNVSGLSLLKRDHGELLHRALSEVGGVTSYLQAPINFASDFVPLLSNETKLSP